MISNTNTRIIKWALSVVVMFAFLLACMSDRSCSDDGTCPGMEAVEQTDLSIRGELILSDHQQVPAGQEYPDLVQIHNSPDSDPQRLDITLNLQTGYRLILRLTDRTTEPGWTSPGIGFGLYPVNEMDDKFRYLTASLKKGNDAAGYESHIVPVYPAVAELDVLSFTDVSDPLNKARIRDLVLYRNTDPSGTITINGTFTGSANN